MLIFLVGCLMTRQTSEEASERVLRPRKGKNLVIILGFNRHVETDVARTKELSKKWDVFTVSRTAEMGRDDHLHARFNDMGNRESQILKMIREKALRQTIDSVFLDYWWPANGYFADSYGLGWLTGWVQALLEAGAREVVLPYNLEVEEMEKNPKALAGEHIRKEESALWKATQKTSSIPCAFNKKKMRGLHESTPFVRFKQGT
jgi:hypothetical protein